MHGNSYDIQHAILNAIQWVNGLRFTSLQTYPGNASDPRVDSLSSERFSSQCQLFIQGHFHHDTLLRILASRGELVPDEIAIRMPRYLEAEAGCDQIDQDQLMDILNEARQSTKKIPVNQNSGNTVKNHKNSDIEVPSDQYEAVRRLARDFSPLQRRILEEICNAGGATPVQNLKFLCNWSDPIDSSWNSARNRINKLLLPIGFQIITRHATACLRKSVSD